MSNDLETLVRPNASLNYAPAKVFYIPGQIGTANTKLQWGRGGGGKTFSGSASYSASFYMTQYTNEKSNVNFGTAF